MLGVKIYYINLERCAERRALMTKYFCREALVRVPAIDGMDWSNGGFDSRGKYLWDESHYDRFVKEGTVAGVGVKSRHLSPMEVACNMSHIRALQTFLDTKDPWAIILEDDVMPTGRLDGKALCDLWEPHLDADFIYLCGPNHPGERLRLYPDGQVKQGRTLMAYAVSRHGAQLMLRAAYPMCHLMDTQIPARLFESMRSKSKCFIPRDLEKLPRFRAYGLFDPLIQHSKIAKHSTFTSDGTKPWIRAEGRV